jgi:hypothetical protein
VRKSEIGRIPKLTDGPYIGKDVTRLARYRVYAGAFP